MKDGYYIPEYEDDPADCVYALNSGEYAHFYVEVLAISRENCWEDRTANQCTPPNQALGGLQTVYSGFTMVSLEDTAILDAFESFGTKRILQEEDWYAFSAIFCPGIPFGAPRDFTQIAIIASIVPADNATYAVARKILGMDPESGLPVFDSCQENWVYALNCENIEHFYVEIIAVDAAKLPNRIAAWVSRS